MKLETTSVPAGMADQDWSAFPGGELEGRRPKTLCPRCRAALQAKSEGLRGHERPANPARRFVCFDCYRADLARERQLKAAAAFVAGSDEHFQSALPLEPVNQARLARLRVERAQARVEARTGSGQYVDRRRQAQIAARHALQRLAEGLRARQVSRAERDRVMAAAFEAAEMQLPEAWLPFVASR
jgi:hypothetical protein